MGDPEKKKFLYMFRWFLGKDRTEGLFEYSPVIMHACIDDPYFKEYFRQRIQYKFLVAGVQTLSIRDRRLSYSQNHICPICNESLYDCDDSIEHHHIMPRKMKGNDKLPNLLLLHGICHRSIHSDNYLIRWYQVLVQFRISNPIISKAQFGIQDEDVPFDNL
jgi:RNA-directed DNA polymerase